MQNLFSILNLGQEAKDKEHKAWLSCPVSRLLSLVFRLLCLIFVPTFLIFLGAEALGGTVEGSLYSDVKAQKVGDVLTVLIFEYSSASNRTETATKKGGDFSVSAGPGRGALDFIPLYAVSGGMKNEYNGSGVTSRSGNLKARMTVSVVEVRDNGDLVIRGSRILEINGEKEIMTLSGVVRPEDIFADNTVYSYNIADARIIYKGKGVISTGGRPGILTRLINWLF